MRKYQRFTKEEIAMVINLKEQGYSKEDIAELLGRETKQIKDLLFRLKKKESATPKEEVKVSVPAPAKPEKTIKDFDPRELFKQLYDLGYRIDDKGIYIMVKQYVNLKSIVNE